MLLLIAVLVCQIRYSSPLILLPVLHWLQHQRYRSCIVYQDPAVPSFSLPKSTPFQAVWNIRINCLDTTSFSPEEVSWELLSHWQRRHNSQNFHVSLSLAPVHQWDKYEHLCMEYCGKNFFPWLGITLLFAW